MPLIDVNGTTLFFDETGSRGAAPVVFSNSLGTTLEMWEAQARAFAGRYRVIRYDTRGHGRSPASAAPVTIDTLGDDLAGLLDALGIEKAHVVGLSLGGMTAQNLAIRHPGKVASLVLMATAPALPPPETWETRAQAVLRDGMAAIAGPLLGRWFTPAFAERDRARLAFFTRMVLGVDPKGYAACCRAIRDMDLRPGLGSITAPTLVIAGAGDPVTTPAMGQELAAAIPGARLEVVADAAHLLAAEQPGDVNALLAEFLVTQAGQPAVHTDAAFQRGLSNRKAVLGVDHVQRSLAGAGPFAAPWQDFITRAAWGEVWGDPTLPWKTRSCVTLAMMVALHREEEFKLHVRPALKNGVSLEELRSLLLQTAIYAGVPAANAAFRWVKDVLGPELDAVEPWRAEL